MKTNHEPYNRRRFIKSVSLSAAIVALSPNFSFGNVELNQKLSISFSDTPLKTITNFKKVFLQSGNFIINSSSLNSDILYVHTLKFDNLKKLESVNKNNTILIVNHQNFDSSTLDYLKNLCNKNKTFLLLIDESQQESEPYLFSKVILHEPISCDTSKINTIFKAISFLSQLTQQNQFFTINQSLA